MITLALIGVSFVFGTVAGGMAIVYLLVRLDQIETRLMNLERSR